jgi:hypothetical protein
MIPLPARPELVEGSPFFLRFALRQKKKQPFDKLRVDGMREAGRLQSATPFEA